MASLVGKSSAAMAVLILLTTSALFSTPTRADQDGVVWNTLATSWDPFYQEIHETAKVGELYNGHVVLAPRPAYTAEGDYLGPSTRWITVTLVGEGVDKVKLFLRDDNLYLVAFITRIGRLYFMKGYEHIFRGLGGVELTFDGSYEELSKEMGGVDSIHTLPLGREAATWAAHVMSEYDHHSATPESVIKRAILSVSIMGPGSLRFSDIREVINQDLGKESFIEAAHVKRMQRWALISAAYYCSAEENKCFHGYIDKLLQNLGLLGDLDRMGELLDIMMRPKRMGLNGELLPQPETEKLKSTKLHY